MKEHPADPVVLAVRDLRKQYGGVAALKGLDLTVRQGEVYGFLGRNGAGKSSAMRIIMGITRAGAGRVELFGEALSGDATALRRQIGYVAQEQHFYAWMTALSLGRFVSGFYPTWDDPEFHRLLRRLDVPTDRKIGGFSGGMVAKLAFALALAHRPRLLLLDEPTAGMDAVARREFIDIVREQALRDGRTTIFSSHLIDEVETAADTVGVVNDGRMLFEGPLELLRQCVRGYEIDQDDHEVSLQEGPLPVGVGGDYGVALIRDRTDKTVRQIIVRGTRAADFEHLQPGVWRPVSLSLEDIFIAMVTRGIDAPLASN